MVVKLKLVVVLIFLLSCRRSHKTEESCCAAESKDCVEISDESIYNITSQWETQNTEKITLKSFEGKVVVAAMVFTHCVSACPRITSDIKKIESALSDNELDNIRFLLISMDPQRDNPEQMKNFMKEFQLDDSHWTIIRSDEEATMELSNILNVRVKPLRNGGFDHSNVIHIINKQGEIVYQQNGLELDLNPTINKIKSLLN